MAFKYKPQAIPAILYLLISIASLMYVFLAPVSESLAGVGAAMLTLPWSLIGVELLDSLQRGKVVSDSMHYWDGMLRVCIAVIGMMINAILLLLVCGYFRKSE